MWWKERDKPWVRRLRDTDVSHVFNEVGEGSGGFSRNLPCLTGASCETVHFLEGFCLGVLQNCRIDGSSWLNAQFPLIFPPLYYLPRS